MLLVTEILHWISSFHRHINPPSYGAPTFPYITRWCFSSDPGYHNFHFGGKKHMRNKSNRFISTKMRQLTINKPQQMPWQRGKLSSNYHFWRILLVSLRTCTFQLTYTTSCKSASDFPFGCVHVWTWTWERLSIRPLNPFLLKVPTETFC